MPTNINLTRPDMFRDQPTPTPTRATARPSDERELIEAERIYRQGVVTVRDLIAPAALKVDPSFLRLNGKF